MEDILVSLLETFEYPVMRQGSLAPEEEYPDTFFTFWCNEEAEHSAYDNNTASVEYDFDVNVYSISPAKAYKLIEDARKLLNKNGWTASSRGYDVASDEATHIGRGMEVIFLKNENQEV